MKKTVALILGLMVIAIMPAVSYAGSPWTENSTYGDKFTGKLDFGIKNAFGGWTELITQPLDAYRNDENYIYASGRGLYNAVIFTLGGIVHLATAPIPVDIQLPGNGVQFGDDAAASNVK